jgi:hypothetical protein
MRYTSVVEEPEKYSPVKPATSAKRAAGVQSNDQNGHDPKKTSTLMDAPLKNLGEKPFSNGEAWPYFYITIL